MKKLLLLIAFVTIFGTAAAQESNPQYIYCELLGTNENLGSKLLGANVGKSKVSIEVDFGQVSSSWASKKLKDENGKNMTFNSMVDAMNWFGAKGWEFVQAYVITTDKQNVLHWLLKLDTSKLTAEEKAEIMSSINVKPVK